MNDSTTEAVQPVQGRVTDRDWLSEVLMSGGYAHAAVTDLEVDTLTMNGAFCTLMRIRLSYENGKNGPSSLIAKMPRTDEGSRAIASAMGLFERERRFFSEVAEHCPVRVPRCYYHGESDDDLLLLEDMVGFSSGNQIQGLSLEQAETALRSLALMHAKFWSGQGEEIGNKQWLIQPDDERINGARCAIIASGACNLRARYSGRLPSEAIEAAENVSKNFSHLQKLCGEGPLTLAHGDARADNWMINAAGEIALIDWQTPAYARGTQDVAYILSNSISVDNQQAHAWNLLRHYYDVLCAQGITGYRWDDFVQHYREHVLFSFYAAFALLGNLAMEGGWNDLADAMIMRNVGLAHSINAFAALK